jgi:predicted MFS family arabinose efflux permease
MYPLGLSLLSDRTSANGLARAYAWYMAIECVGSQAGAAAMGKARDLWGDASMFAVGFIALVAVLAFWLTSQILLRRQKRREGFAMSADRAA